MNQLLQYRNFYALLLYCCMAMGLQACETLGYGGVDINTTRKSIAVANAEIRGAVLLTQDLLGRGAITPHQAQETKDTLQDAKDALQGALIAVDRDGDPVKAESGIESAKIAIRIALNFLGPMVEANQ